MEDAYQNYTQGNGTSPYGGLGFNYTYIYITVPIITFCLCSVTTNLLVLGSLFWVRRPITPTLHISLSLAFSDLLTIFLDGLSLFFNSLLPVGFGVRLEIPDDCTLLFLEAVRLGCRFTTLGHLHALAFNHYLGIRKPLQYPSLMTSRHIWILITCLWILPTVTFLLYFSSLDNDGFSSCTIKFMAKFYFRGVISWLFFGSIILMSGVYLHIYILVLKHQALRNKFRRAGSTYNRAHHRTANQVTEERNEKALFTTMLIVGSTVVGWLPASLAFLLVCEDCLVPRLDQPWGLVVNSASNILLISKTALNTYIYAARMSEIRMAMKRMHMSLRRQCCKNGSPEMNSFSESLQRRTSHRRSQRTLHCRMHSLNRRSSTTTPL